MVPRAAGEDAGQVRGSQSRAYRPLRIVRWPNDSCAAAVAKQRIDMAYPWSANGCAQTPACCGRGGATHFQPGFPRAMGTAPLTENDCIHRRRLGTLGRPRIQSQIAPSTGEAAAARAGASAAS